MGRAKNEGRGGGLHSICAGMQNGIYIKNNPNYSNNLEKQSMILSVLNNYFCVFLQDFVPKPLASTVASESPTGGSRIWHLIYCVRWHQATSKVAQCMCHPSNQRTKQTTCGYGTPLPICCARNTPRGPQRKFQLDLSSWADAEIIGWKCKGYSEEEPLEWVSRTMNRDLPYQVVGQIILI